MDIQTWSAAATIVSTIVGAVYILVRLLLKKFEQVEGRFGQIDERFEQIDGRFDRVETRLDAKIDKTRDELQASLEAARSEFKTEVAGLRNDFQFLSRTIINFLAHPPERTAPSRSE